MQQAQVGKYAFTVPDEWTKEDVMREWNLQASGVINMCDQCQKMDIDIRTHFDKCNPIREIQKQTNLEFYD